MNSLIPAVPPVLYHLTCVEHGHPGILGSGMVKPGPSGIAWFTDLSEGNRIATGVARFSEHCDKGAIRYRIDDTAGIVPYLAFRQSVRAEDRFSPGLAKLLDLENFPGVLPRHWFVSWAETPATYDPF